MYSVSSQLVVIPINLILSKNGEMPSLIEFWDLDVNPVMSMPHYFSDDHCMAFRVFCLERAFGISIFNGNVTAI